MVWALLNAEHRTAMKEITDSQSDRITAILGGVMFDDSLRVSLEMRLRPKDGNTDMNDKLFRVNGPMGNAAPKIDLAYQLYMLDKKSRNSMHGICEIRNLFAHNMTMTFASSSEKLKTSLGKLELHDGVTKYPHPFFGGDSEDDIEKVTTPKEIFILNVKLSLIVLMRDRRIHQIHTNLPLA
jgi:hypothetical protein